MFAFFGKYPLSNPLLFSLLPLCQLEYGSAKYTFTLSLSCSCFTNSLPLSNVNVFAGYTLNVYYRFAKYLIIIGSRLVFIDMLSDSGFVGIFGVDSFLNISTSKENN